VLLNVKKIFIEDILITVKYSYCIFWERSSEHIHFQKTLTEQQSYAARSFTPEVNLPATSRLPSGLSPSFQLCISGTLLSSGCLSEMLRSTSGQFFRNFGLFPNPAYSTKFCRIIFSVALLQVNKKTEG